MVFWDLREPFLEDLYKISVKDARIGNLIELLDPVSPPFPLGAVLPPFMPSFLCFFPFSGALLYFPGFRGAL